MSSPWFKFSRRYIKSPFFGNPKFDPIYMWFASEASQVEHSILNGNREVVLRPGQFLTGRLRACEKLGLTAMEWRNRLKTLMKNHLIDAFGTNRYTLITLIDPNTYIWQRDVYSRKGTNKTAKKEPSKNQQRTTTIEVIDHKAKTPACAQGENGEEGEMDADAVGPSSSELNDAEFSEYKDAILDLWAREREKAGLLYVKTAKNSRAAVMGAAMVERGDWNMEIIAIAIATLMAFEDERRNYTLAGLFENLELWANGGPVKNGEPGKTGRRNSSKNGQPRFDQHTVTDVMEARRRGRAEAAGMGRSDDGFDWGA